MNIALIGYGKTGKAIEEIALQRGHNIVLIVRSTNKQDLISDKLARADVAIEFTGPESAFQNVMHCLRAQVPVVVGSTGWLKNLQEAQDACQEHDSALLVSSNFSVGVNFFFEINKRLAELMSQQEEYDIAIEEIHHTHKKDAPSGTAITIAEQILQRITRKSDWVNARSASPDQLSIISKRVDPAPGTHAVLYTSEIDDIEIRHTAHNRKGFAAGAVRAAEFLTGKKGIYNMSDVLGL
ncbi:MAG: 4-hydroxy-tetrahydrodipicolinate reductase [Chitinophagaceae bacterium]|nr:4-hydroxy-tetrahydrodipicolinate reductase [Chitinophagaceae bacterium]